MYLGVSVAVPQCHRQNNNLSKIFGLFLVFSRMYFMGRHVLAFPCRLIAEGRTIFKASVLATFILASSLCDWEVTFAAINTGGTLGDEQTSLVYDPTTGKLLVDAPASVRMVAISITSDRELFIGERPAVLDGRFDKFGSKSIFKVIFGRDNAFGDISFGNVLPAGLSEEELAADLTVVGSLLGGVEFGEVDLVYGPLATVLLEHRALDVDALNLANGGNRHAKRSHFGAETGRTLRHCGGVLLRRRPPEVGIRYRPRSFALVRRQIWRPVFRPPCLILNNRHSSRR